MKNAFYSNTEDQYAEGKKLFFHTTDEAWFKLHRIIPQRSSLANALSHLYKHLLTTIEPLNLTDNDPSNELRIIQHIYSLVPGHAVPPVDRAGHNPDVGLGTKGIRSIPAGTPSVPNSPSSQAPEGVSGDRGTPSKGSKNKR